MFLLQNRVRSGPPERSQRQHPRKIAQPKTASQSLLISQDDEDVASSENARESSTNLQCYHGCRERHKEGARSNGGPLVNNRPEDVCIGAGLGKRQKCLYQRHLSAQS
ncbi:unnamed protein product [Haemonchus placei]|uniref:Uncharacterized protein n=1 Tax=Haemonchus placei TaxID=6290 RepID=A0A0N4X043_HAEPC|nr:unnamed protein product [Haemonchus placei]